MDLEETLGKIVELSREELDVVRKRAEEKTAARDHGRDQKSRAQARGFRAELLPEVALRTEYSCAAGCSRLMLNKGAPPHDAAK